MSRAGLPDAFTCANCEAAAQGDYCATCGQKRPRPGDLSVAHAIGHLADELLDVDGRIFRTLRVLFLEPGRLTLDFLSGRRARYVHPVRLFLVVSGLYFLAEAQAISPSTLLHGPVGATTRQALQARAAREGLAYPALLEEADARVHTVFKLAVIATVLVNGGCYWIVFRRVRPYLAEHLVTALHLSTFGMIVALVLGYPGKWWRLEAIVGGLVSALGYGYGALALRQLYPTHGVAIGAAMTLTIIADLLFVTAVPVLVMRATSGAPLI
jgi:hypothetical protein